MDELRDIKPIFDFNEYLFILWIALGVIVLILVIFFLYKKFFKRNTKKEMWIKILKDLELKDTKMDAYLMSKYGALLVANEKNREIFNELEKELEKYKYKKEVPTEFDNKTLGYYHAFLESIDG